MKEYTLLGNSFIIEPLEETIKGGIITSENDSLKKAKVIQAGQGVWESGVFIPNPVKEGAIIFYKSDQEYKIDGKKILGTTLNNVVFYKNEV